MPSCAHEGRVGAPFISAACSWIWKFVENLVQNLSKIRRFFFRKFVEKFAENCSKFVDNSLKILSKIRWKFVQNSLKNCCIAIVHLSKILLKMLLKMSLIIRWNFVEILFKICETARGGRADKRRVRVAARPAYQRRISLLTWPGAYDPPPTSGSLPFPLTLRTATTWTGDSGPTIGINA